MSENHEIIVIISAAGDFFWISLYIFSNFLLEFDLKFLAMVKKQIRNHGSRF